jgi:hypothetical protein
LLEQPILALLYLERKTAVEVDISMMCWRDLSQALDGYVATAFCL